MTDYTDSKSAFSALRDELNRVNRDAISSLFQEIIASSPYGDPTLWKQKPHKDYTPGHYKGNWQVTKDTPATTELPGVPSPQVAAVTLKDMKVEDTVYLTNNAIYAERIEHGWSTQRPSGWVRNIVNSAPNFLANSIKIRWA